jgi:hypothetical protein
MQDFFAKQKLARLTPNVEFRLKRAPELLLRIVHRNPYPDMKLVEFRAAFVNGVGEMVFYSGYPMEVVNPNVQIELDEIMPVADPSIGDVMWMEEWEKKRAHVDRQLNPQNYPPPPLR